MNFSKNCLVVLLFFSMLFLCALLCGVVTIVGTIVVGSGNTSGFSENYISGTGERKVVLIDIKGEISNSGGGLLSSNATSSTQVISQIQSAMDDENVVGLLIEMDTPGGEIVASDLIYQKLLDAKVAGLKVVTDMQTLGASGGYYIAVASDLILANDLTTTGSIGVYSVFQDVSGLYEKLGIQQRTIKHGDYKTGDGLFDDDDTGEEDKIYQALVDQAYDKFVSVVAEGREMGVDEVRLLADGRVFSGAQAVKNGLIDEIGGYNEAVDALARVSGMKEFRVVRYTSLDFWDSVFNVLSFINVDKYLVDLAKSESEFQLMYKLQ